MPRVGSSRMSTLGFVSSHLLMTTFCWLPPESDAAGVSTDGARMRSRSRKRSAAARSSATRMSPAAVQEAVERRQRDVRRDRLGEDRARGRAGPRWCRRCRAPSHRAGCGRGSRAVELDAAALGGRDAEERQPDVGAARADETGEPEHLAGAQVERDALEGALDREVLDAQDDLARVRRCALEELDHGPARPSGGWPRRRQLGPRASSRSSGRRAGSSRGRRSRRPPPAGAR